MVKTILIQDDNEYDLVNEAREMLIHRGLDALPKEIAAEVKKKVKLQSVTRGTLVIIACVVLTELLKKESGVGKK